MVALLLLIFSVNAAKVDSIKKTDTNEYQVLLKNHSAYYKSNNKNIKCLLNSIRNNIEIDVEINRQNLLISTCKLKPH